MTRSIALALAAVECFSGPAAAQIATQFDLICTGTIESGSSATRTEREAMTDRYRFDLEKMVWCTDDCASTHPIVEANSAEITLVDSRSPDGATSHKKSVSRTSGVLTGNIQTRAMGAIVFVRTNAHCTRADFSGMPQAQF